MRFLKRLGYLLLNVSIILSTVGFSQSAALSQDHQFVHPGIQWTASDLDRLAERTTVSPWKEGYLKMVDTDQGSLDYEMRLPIELDENGEEIPLDVANKGANQREHTSDAQAALYHAVQFGVTGNEDHARLATDIVDAWAIHHKTWSGNSVHLHAAWRGGMMVRAAEILRYTYDDWTPANTEHCETYFKEVLLPVLRPGNPLRAANQGANNLWGMVQVAIFTNDQELFQECLDAYLNDPCAGISNSLPNGQCGDSGRDQGHAAAMIGNLGATAQILYTQGVDVYPVLDNRLLKVMEYWCQYNSDQEVEFIDHGTCYGYYTSIGADGRRDNYPDFASVYENVRSAYVVRAGLEAPHTLDYIDRVYNGSDGAQIDTFFNRKDASFPASATASREPYTPFTLQDVTSLNSTDIGDPRRVGNNNFSNGIWTVNGSGNGFDEGDDTSYHFVYTQLSGDGEMIAKVESLENTDVNAGAALVLRTSLTVETSDAANVYARPTQGSQFSSRGIDAGDGDGAQTFPLSNLDDGDVWLRLERRGNSVVGYVGPDGLTWAPMQHVIFDDLPDTVFIGLASTSHDNGTVRAEAGFSNVQISAQPELAVVATGSNEPPTVRNNDLGQTAFLTSSATSSTELGTEHGQLFNGLIGNEDNSSGNIGEVRMNAGDTFTIDFDTVAEPEGYDISEINSVFGWNTAAGGRSNQGYGIRFNLVDGSSRSIPGQHWAPNSPAFFWTSVTISEASGEMLATGVASITFEVTERAVPRGVVIAREFDISGSPTNQPDVLLGDANGDGSVNTRDISAFGLALFNPGAYELAYPDSFPEVVLDMNGDEAFNSRDIAGFGAALGF